MTDSVRLAKYLAAHVVCSRREAEQYIEGGWVTVDGVTVEEPGFRVAGEEVCLLPGATTTPLASATILLHKPAAFEALDDIASVMPLIIPESHFAEDGSKTRLLRRQMEAHTPAAPLNARSSGLTVLTQNWRVIRALAHDAARIEHEFVVDVTGIVAADGLQRLNAGIPLPGRPPGLVKASWQNETRLRFAAKALKPGHIEIMCKAVGLKATSMRRIRIGRIAIGNLPLGQWRLLRADERF
ncbi:MAG: rRNA pseudouridine synthase [Burkholderiaceae bacterium]